MLILRSLAFNIAFYVNLILWMLGALPFLLASRRLAMRIVKAWARSSLWLLKVLAGTDVRFEGLEHIPQGGCLVAAKHQSMWETFALFTIFDDPAFVLKRELMWIPFFGWYAWKTDMISVDRGKGMRAMENLSKRTAQELAKGRQIILFPEGTRRAPGARPAYKQGIAHLYATGQSPCLPVALNSGLFWPRRRFIRRPGIIDVVILPPLAPGMAREGFFKAVQESIESACQRLPGLETDGNLAACAA